MSDLDDLVIQRAESWYYSQDPTIYQPGMMSAFKAGFLQGYAKWQDTQGEPEMFRWTVEMLAIDEDGYLKHIRGEVDAENDRDAKREAVYVAEQGGCTIVKVQRVWRDVNTA